jgi:Mor family transcriptional regulator
MSRHDDDNAMTILRALLKKYLDDKQASDVADSFQKYYSGGTVYIPKFCQKDVRNEEIFERYNGKNARALCREYDLSYSYLLCIIRKQARCQQRDLFA